MRIPGQATATTVSATWRVPPGRDAHSVHEFDNLRFGVGQARRGWLEKKDVLNTRTLGEVRRLLKRPA